MSYRFLFPQVSIGPNARACLIQSIPGHELARLLGNRDADIEIGRNFVQRGRVIATRVDALSYRGGRWTNAQALNYTAPANAAYDWTEPDNVAYVETSVSALGGPGFSEADGLSFYTIYASDSGKTYFSDNALKYGDRNVIQLYETFQTLLACYPTCLFDRARDITESVVFFNPYSSPVAATVELDEPRRSRNILVPSLSSLRLDIARLLDPGVDRWWGTVFVRSKARPLFMFAKHSIADPNVVTTIEHSLAYYANRVRTPATRRARYHVGRLVLEPIAAIRRRAALRHG